MQVEVSLRELDSKLLLATLAAAKGHQVIVSDLSEINRGLKRKLLMPGIFHTKSLTPNDKKLALHKEMINKGFVITSIDEEAGLSDQGYDEMARERYSNESIEQSSAVFGWGQEDTETLQKTYSKHSSKIYKTGSPRVDLWTSLFSEYWGVPKAKPLRPFLLVPSNMLFSNKITFHENIKMHRILGYFDRDPKKFAWLFKKNAEDGLMTLAFIEAIKYLAKNNQKFDIVLRPHPAENIDAWKIYLENISNVHVLQEGPITAWVNNCFAIMHNGCTTALEAAFSGKPVITYMPFKQEYSKQLANQIGYIVKSRDELLQKINTIFKNSQLSKIEKLNEELPKLISNKVYYDKKELAAEKIIKVWENFNSDKLSQKSNWTKFELILRALEFKDNIWRILQKISPNKFRSYKDNKKFPPLDKTYIYKQIIKIKNILGIKEDLEYKLLSKRALLIRRKNK